MRHTRRKSWGRRAEPLARSRPSALRNRGSSEWPRSRAVCGRVCASPHHGSRAPVPPVDQAAPGDPDLLVLPARRRVSSLVVTAEQQDDPAAVCVAEYAQQDSLLLGCPDGAPEPELEETLSELPAKLRRAHGDALLLQLLAHGLAERESLRVRELLPEPAQDGLVAVLVLVEFELVRHRGQGSHHGPLSLVAKTRDRGTRDR